MVQGLQHSHGQQLRPLTGVYVNSRLRVSSLANQRRLCADWESKKFGECSWPGNGYVWTTGADDLDNHMVGDITKKVESAEVYNIDAVACTSPPAPSPPVLAFAHP